MQALHASTPAVRAADTQDPAAQRRAVVAVLEHAARHYRTNLAGSPEALRYLGARGLTWETIQRFALGFARPVWRDLHRVIRDHDDSAVVDCGLLVFKDGDPDGLRFDRFRSRIMFPIRDVDGHVIAFGGRALGEGEHVYGKYINSPDSTSFDKSQTVFGLHEARQAITDSGSAIVVEGYLDVLQASQHGFENTVATMGTACTREQVASILAFTSAITFCFDGDSAGRAAASRALRTVLPFATDHRSFRFAFLPEGHDPDSLCRAGGAQALRSELDQALDLTELLLREACEGCDLTIAEGRARLVHQARALWRGLPNGSLRDALLAHVANASNMPADDVLYLWHVAARSAPSATQSSDRAFA